MAREERRIQILKAAVKVFFRQGFEKARVDEIAENAGIGKGTVYEYFVSKQQLFDETMMFATKIYIQKITEAMADAKTIREKIISFARYQTSFSIKHSPVLKVMCSSQVMVREMGAAMLQQNVKLWELWQDILQKAKNNKEIRPDLNEDIATAMILGTINQYCSKSAIFEQIDPSLLLYDELADAVLTGIK